MPNAAAPLLQLDDVRKRYGQFHALRGVTLTAPSGRIGLLGPNGAGKSTLLKVLLGLIPFEGDGARARPRRRRDGVAIRDRVGYMPERDATWRA